METGYSSVIIPEQIIIMIHTTIRITLQIFIQTVIHTELRVV